MSSFLEKVEAISGEERSKIAYNLSSTLKKNSELRTYILKAILPYFKKAVGAWTREASRAKGDNRILKELETKFKLDKDTGALAIWQVINNLDAAISAQIPKSELAVYIRDAAKLKSSTPGASN